MSAIEARLPLTVLTVTRLWILEIESETEDIIYCGVILHNNYPILLWVIIIRTVHKMYIKMSTQ